MGVRYEENRAGVRAMLSSPEMSRAMVRVGELIRIEAERIAPVDTGAYAFGLPGKPGVHGGGFKVTPIVKGGAAGVRVSNDVRRGDYCYAAALEFGTSKMRRQRPLGRALDAVAAHRI